MPSWHVQHRSLGILPPVKLLSGILHGGQPTLSLLIQPSSTAQPHPSHANTLRQILQLTSSSNSTLKALPDPLLFCLLSGCFDECSENHLGLSSPCHHCACVAELSRHLLSLAAVIMHSQNPSPMSWNFQSMPGMVITSKQNTSQEPSLAGVTVCSFSQANSFV